MCKDNPTVLKSCQNYIIKNLLYFLMSKELFLGSKLSDEAFLLENAEHHHCIRVTRHKLGDDILISDFNGSIFRGRIQEIFKEQTSVQIIAETKLEKLDPKIRIAISPTQQMDRFEWFVEKAVECGVHEIIPLKCDRTENTRVKTERIAKIMLAAAKQTHRAFIPICQEIIPFKKFIDQCNVAQKFICHCLDGHTGNLGELYNPNEDVVVLIGPAGDFSLEEIKSATTNGFINADLGNFRLRTETAGIISCSILSQKKMLSEKNN